MANLETEVLEQNTLVPADAIPEFLHRDTAEGDQAVDPEEVTQTQADVGAEGLNETEETLR